MVLIKIPLTYVDSKQLISATSEELNLKLYVPELLEVTPMAENAVNEFRVVLHPTAPKVLHFYLDRLKHK